MANSTPSRIIIYKNNDVFTINGVRIRRDERGYINITDIWKAMGQVRGNRPAAWAVLPTTLGFIAATERFLKVRKSDLLISTAGRGGGTYAHPQIALEYAQYQDPDLAVAVNQEFLQRVAEEQNPDLILDRAEATYLKKGCSQSYIRARFLGKATRKDFVSILARHGVQGPDGFRLCTNAIYKPLWGGNAAHIRQRKNLPAKANTREHMSEKELVGLHLTELLAAESIEQKQVQGTRACAAECGRAAQSVARMIIQHQQGNYPLAA